MPKATTMEEKTANERRVKQAMKTAIKKRDAILKAEQKAEKAQKAALAKLKPTRAAFNKYLDKYPLAFWDAGFMDVHRGLNKKFNRDFGLSKCKGCSHCIFGKAISQLNQREIKLMVKGGLIF